MLNQFENLLHTIDGALTEAYQLNLLFAIFEYSQLSFPVQQIKNLNNSYSLFYLLVRVWKMSANLSRVYFEETGRYNQVKWTVFWTFEQFEDISSCFRINARTTILSFTLLRNFIKHKISKKILELYSSRDRCHHWITWKSPPTVCVLPLPVCPYAKHVAMPPSKMVWTNGLAEYLYTFSLSQESSKA